MFTKSDQVKAWRKRTKERIIESMGGKCQCCGYNKCPDVFDVHHLDPQQKDFSLSQIRASPKKWEIICAELRKCILLCANCHREIHAGARSLPHKFARFDETFLDYRRVERIEKGLLDPCPICNALKPHWNRSCSLSCSSKLRGKVDWGAVDLQSMFEQGMNYCSIGRKLGISDNAVRKRAKKLGLKPVPKKRRHK